MRRRTFLQTLALAGLSMMVPSVTGRARANDKYGGPYYVFVNAGGGWDPTLFCDPKGGASGDRDSVNQTYAPGDIRSAGVFRYAPVSASLPTTDGGTVEVYSVQRFFEAHQGRLLVLNGVDTATNNHDAGSRTVWSGQLTEGYPAFAALVAAVKTASLSIPMPFVSNGGFDATESLVPLTRTGSLDALRRVAYPLRLDASKADSPLYHSSDTYARIARAQNERLERMKGGASLPYSQASMGNLYFARNADQGLASLAEALGSQKLITLEDLPDLALLDPGRRYEVNDMIALMQQAQIAVLAFQAGAAVSVNMNLGGFDTHAGHDNDHMLRLMKLLRGVDYLFTFAAQQGVLDRMVVVIGSDFGRTPYYNSQNGKDHWNITSLMLAGPGIPGNRVIGGTDDGFKPLTVNPSSLALDESGIRLQTTHVHKALRRLAGIDGSDLAARFPLPGEDLPLFG